MSEGSACTSAASLSERLAARGVAIDPRATASSVDVTIAPTPSGMTARFVVKRSGRAASRELFASTCEDVVEALSFAIALALEDTGPPPESAPTPPAPPEVPSPPPSPVAPPPVSEPAPSRAPEPDAIRASPEARPPSGIEISFGAKVGASLGAAPDPTGLVALHVDLGSKRQNGFSPLASLGAVLVFPDASSTRGLGVDFASQHGELDLCPLRFGSESLGIRPCARLELGRLQARSQGFTGARLDESAWAGLGAGARARWRLGARLFVEAEIVAILPLVRNTFFVNGFEAFTPPSALGRAGIGAGAHFP